VREDVFRNEGTCRQAFSQPVSESTIQFLDQQFGVRPRAKTGGRVEMTHRSQRAQLSAPAFGEVGDGFEAGEVIVSAGSDQAAKR
jgi:hypothetical protein